MANFLVKFPIFRYHGNRGCLTEQSLTDTIKLADLDNPLVGASIWGVSPAQDEFENSKFSLPWQQGSVRAKCDWHI